jgi:hypothetical protein
VSAQARRRGQGCLVHLHYSLHFDAHQKIPYAVSRCNQCSLESLTPLTLGYILQKSSTYYMAKRIVYISDERTKEAGERSYAASSVDDLCWKGRLYWACLSRSSPCRNIQVTGRGWCGRYLLPGVESMIPQYVSQMNILKQEALAT